VHVLCAALAVQGADEIVIVEGELDKLAIEEALFQVAASTVDGSTEPAAAADPAVFMTTPDGTKRAVVSVPAGAPSRAASTSQSQERKFKFVSGMHSDERRLQYRPMACAEKCAQR
jgi:2-methylcitrate dehydratase PrpD